MLRQNDEAKRDLSYYIDLSDVTSAERANNKPMKFITNEGEFYSACINCHQPRCLTYYENEYVCSGFDNFAERQDSRVCAFNEIAWDNSKQSIVIQLDACVGCGICASRCPFGAIYADNEKMAISLDRADDRFRILRSDEDALALQDECVGKTRGLTVNVVRNTHVLDRAKSVYQCLDGSKASHEAALLLCRNLMIEAGTQCALRRTGVSGVRMDAVYASEKFSGAIEIEFQSDSLSVARNLLDDVAMMQARSGLPIKSNTPLAICAAIPNTRQGYYQVCDDINRILGLHIRTLTIASLLILVWNGVKLNLEGDRFHLGFREASIRKYIESLLGYELCGDDSAGLLEPIK